LTWLTEAGDAIKSARYNPACNSTFELGAAEVKCYGWPDISAACYGQVQRFVFIVRRATEQAVLLAAVKLFTSVAVDELTSLPLVDTDAVSTRFILARHLNWRVIMPIVGATRQLLKEHADCTRAVNTAKRAVRTVSTTAAIGRKQDALDAAMQALDTVTKKVQVMQTSRRLVLGARANDDEAVVPPI
jgi:hypothetical protein